MLHMVVTPLVRTACHHPAYSASSYPCPTVVRGEASTLFHWHEKEHHEQKEGAKAQAQDAAASGAESKKDT